MNKTFQKIIQILVGRIWRKAGDRI